MQDQDKWRDRVELSLDNRQIFLIFSAMAVVVALVFALGVVVGKRMALDAPDKPATDPLALLDQISGEQAHQERKLTFPQALTHAPRRPPSARAEPAVAPAKPKAGETPAPAEQEPQRPSRQQSTPMAREESRPKASVAAHKEAVPPGRKPAVDKGKAKQDSATSQYTLQLSSFQDRLEAEQFMERLRSGGLTPRMVPAQIPGRGLWYRVRIGDYGSWDQALAAKEDFERSHKVIAYVARR